MQFAGSTLSALSTILWRAETEPKCRFLAWLVINGKAPTADNLAKKNWPHPMYPLCLCMQETNEHLSSQCNYTEATWARIASQLQLPQDCRSYNPQGLVNWVYSVKKSRPKSEQKKLIGVLLTFWWHLWKERNRRIFENQETSHVQLANLVVDEIKLFQFVKQCGDSAVPDS